MTATATPTSKLTGRFLLMNEQAIRDQKLQERFQPFITSTNEKLEQYAETIKATLTDFAKDLRPDAVKRERGEILPRVVEHLGDTATQKIEGLRRLIQMPLSQAAMASKAKRKDDPSPAAVWRWGQALETLRRGDTKQREGLLTAAANEGAAGDLIAALDNASPLVTRSLFGNSDIITKARSINWAMNNAGTANLIRGGRQALDIVGYNLARVADAIDTGTGRSYREQHHGQIADELKRLDALAPDPGTGSLAVALADFK